ncbi:unnamed protein product [Linum trigynum]|uniref:Uncharacterized protein n=1 Tax=Linum trigynum TaxID=586398 RepID=A0AAV2D8Q8_9ROSI
MRLCLASHRSQSFHPHLLLRTSGSAKAQLELVAQLDYGALCLSNGCATIPFLLAPTAIRLSPDLHLLCLASNPVNSTAVCSAPLRSKENNNNNKKKGRKRGERPSGTHALSPLADRPKPPPSSPLKLEARCSMGSVR